MIFMFQNRFSRVFVAQNKLGGKRHTASEKENTEIWGWKRKAFFSNAKLYCLLTEMFTTLVNSSTLKGLSCNKLH